MEKKRRHLIILFRRSFHLNLIFTIRQVLKVKSSQPNEPDQPDRLSPNLDPGLNPTQLILNLDPGSPTWPEIGFKLGCSFGFNKYIIGLNPNLNLIWGQPYPIGPVFWPWGPNLPESTQILGPKLGSTPKNGSGLATLLNISKDFKLPYSLK